MMVKMKSRWHRYDITSAKPRHGYEYTKHKKSQYDDGYVQ